MCSPGGAIEGVIAIVRDATTSYAARDALARSEAKLRMAADAGGVGLWSWEPETGVIEWEDAMCALFGLAPGNAPKTSEQYMALIHPEDRERSFARESRWREVGEWEGDYRILRADGATRWVTSKARVLRSQGKAVVLGSAWDVTEGKERDERQRAAQRLEVVGQLTAGIAHNFNNMLMGLLPNLELAARRAPPDLVPMLRDAQRSGQRAADLVRQLLTYAGRNQKANRSAEPLGLLVDRTVAFCRTTIDGRIAIEVRSDASAAASVDATHIEQALLNLILNARDAFDGSREPSPAIRVRPGRAQRGARVRGADRRLGAPQRRRQRLGDGRRHAAAHLRAVLHDEGGGEGDRPGARHHPRDRPRSRRLSRVRLRPGEGNDDVPLSAGRAHRPGGGRAKVVEAPARRGLAGRRNHGARRRRRRGAAPRPRACVLVDVGFDVETTASGPEALERIADPQVAMRVSVVLLDVSMPGMSGPQLRVRLRDALPHARAAFLTGHAFDAGPGDVVLQKPITRDVLVTTLRALLALE